MQKSLLYANGVVASLSNSLVSQETFNRLIEAHSNTEALSILQETAFGSGVAIDSPFEIDEVLSFETKKLVEFIKNESPLEELTKFLLLPFDYNNIAGVCKGIVLNQNPDEYFEAEGCYEIAKIKDYITTKRFEEFKNPFINYLLNQFLEQASKPKLNGQEIDFLFKKCMYNNLREVVRKNALLSKIVGYEIDIENISVAMRAKTQFHFEQQLLSGKALSKDKLLKIFGKDRSVIDEVTDPILQKFVKYALAEDRGNAVVDFEIYKNKYIFEILKPKKLEIESFAPFLLYVYTKWGEIKNIRLIMSYHNNNLGDRIKKRFLEC